MGSIPVGTQICFLCVLISALFCFRFQKFQGLVRGHLKTNLWQTLWSPFPNSWHLSKVLLVCISCVELSCPCKIDVARISPFFLTALNRIRIFAEARWSHSTSECNWQNSVSWIIVNVHAKQQTTKIKLLRCFVIDLYACCRQMWTSYKSSIVFVSSVTYLVDQTVLVKSLVHVLNVCIPSPLSCTLQSVSSCYPKAGSIVDSVLWGDHEGKLGLSVLCCIFARI